MPIEYPHAGAVAHHGKGQARQMAEKGGRQVKSGDVIAEIETDKATMEVEAVDEGTLGKIVVPEGTEDVAVNTPIAVIRPRARMPAPSPRGAASRRPRQRRAEARARRGQAAKAAAARPRRAAAPPPRRASRCRSGERDFASPLARRIAKEAGSICRLTGSGPHGRVVKATSRRRKPAAPQGRARRRAGPASAGALAAAMPPTSRS